MNADKRTLRNVLVIGESAALRESVVFVGTVDGTIVGTIVGTVVADANKICV